MQDDGLFQAMTRPASRWGVSLEWMTLNFCLTMMGFIGLKTFWAFVFGLALHPVGVLLYRHDPYQLRIIGVWLQRCGAAVGRVKFQISGYLP